MSIHPLALLRGVLLVILAAGATQQASAHDWPFQADASERFLTSVRLPTLNQPQEAPPADNSFATSFKIADAARVLLSSVNKGVDLAKYLSAPRYFQFKSGSETALTVASPVNRAAPVPAGSIVPDIVYAEHCLGEEYLPYDLNTSDIAQAAMGQSLSGGQQVHLARSIRTALSKAAQWHCEVIDQTHSARFATDAGRTASKLSLSIARATHNAFASIAADLRPCNFETLPKYVYLQTRSGTVLAPAYLAQQWTTYEPVPEVPQAHLLVQTGNELRTALSQQIERVASSLLTVARLVNPSGQTKIATRTSSSSR